MSYSMSLANILALLNIACDDESLVTALTLDSRAVKQGALFFAYPGLLADGRDYIEQAQAAGAVAIIYEKADFSVPANVTIPIFSVDGLQQKVGLIAHEFYRQPTGDMQVFGVTGTNGKTTCCYLLVQALTAMGLRAAMIGTIGVGPLGALSSASHTTPDPISIHKLFASFRDQGITQVCMEVSSHALDQGRVNGVQFFCALFTNLSHDHLDYHGNMQNYAAAKQRLFTDFSTELAVVNADDELGATLDSIATSEFVVRYGRGGDVYADEVQLAQQGLHLVIEGNGVDFEIESPLIGQVNVPNLEMLVAVLLGLSTEISDIQQIVAQLSAAPGRMELYSVAGKPKVVVDYAHTPDALQKALQSLRKHCAGELWCVFGCGGDRDREKRSVMGAAADQFADRSIITNDNPRSEDGAAIAADIEQGIKGEYQIVLNRAEAIGAAIAQAANDDWILVAGKGHETTQQIGDEILPFSDRSYVANTLGATEHSIGGAA